MKPAALLLAVLLLAGCRGTGSAPVEASSQEASEALAVEETLPTREPPAGSGRWSDPGELGEEGQALILQFLDRYYDSMAVLEAEDLGDLFVEADSSQALGNQAVLNYVIQNRLLQPTDLSLTGCDYVLECRDVQGLADGSLQLTVVEDNTLNFAAYPGVDSQSLDVYHRFVLEENPQGEWKIAQHVQMNSLYWMVMGPYAFAGMRDDGAALDESGAAQYFAEQTARLLEEAQAAVARRATQGQEPDASLSWDHDYDREGTVAYAQEWVGRRNDQWADYSGYGGNCQNFTSQCLLAGGIPMDIQSPGIWKWYGATPNNLPQPSGRSASWSSVDDFLLYAQENQGYGLVATADAPYYSGQPGDLLHLRAFSQSDWRHTVLITGLCTDETGQTIDYLVNSNTGDLRNYPASAYSYACQLLIRVHGWHD